MKLSKRQVETYRLYLNGIKPKEIINRTGYPKSTVYAAPKRCKRNIELALDTLNDTIEKDLLTSNQKIYLKNLLRKIVKT